MYIDTIFIDSDGLNLTLAAESEGEAALLTLVGSQVGLTTGFDSASDEQIEEGNFGTLVVTIPVPAKGV